MSNDDIMDGDLTELELSDSEFSAASEGEAEESEFEMDSEPAAKRRKIDKLKTKASKTMAAPKARKATRNQGRLQNMLSMPLDILFELFSNLTPGDLLSLARTSKSLRSVLMSRKSVSVWKAARSQVPGLEAPEPPEDMSEPAWAQLLYGRPVCSECGANNIHRIDFALRRRLCTKCMKQCLVYASSFRNKCPGLDPSIMDYLPYTNTGGWAHGHASNSRFYMKSDILAMSTKLAELTQDKKALKEFRKERILLVDAIMHDCAGYDQWANEATRSRRMASHDLKKKRYDDIVQRLLDAGYEKADILDTRFTRLYSQPGVESEKAVTDQVWKRIKGMLEEAVTNGRAERLEEQRAHTRRSRHIAALGEYSKFRQLILPAQWAYLPNAPQAAVALACFQEVINKEEDVTTADWASAVQKLPQCLSEWMENKKAQYLAMLPVSNVVFPAMEVTQLDSPSVGVVRREGMESYANVLELVLSVFTTDGQCALFGRDTCRTWELEPHDVTFSLRGAQAALALAQTLEVDPKLTKATALDKLNRRFVCMTCVQKDGNSIDHMSAYSWRGCVEHYMKTEKSDHPAPQWRVLDAQRTANIILREIALPANAQRDSARAWFCNHCSLYRVDDRMGPMMYAMHSSLQTRAIVTDHLRSVHNIAAPVDGVDLLYHVHPGERRPIPQPVLVNPRQTVTQPPQNATQFRCAHCQPSSGMHPGPVAKRLFKLDGLKSHAMAKHDINRVLEPGIDYY